MAMSVTTTEKTTFSPRQIKFVWVSAADGTATGTTTNRYNGAVIDAVFVNGTTPTDQYDITVTDSNSVDVLNALGANLSNAATTHKVYKDGLGAVVDSTLTLNVTNAGDTKGGTVILTIV